MPPGLYRGRTPLCRRKPRHGGFGSSSSIRLRRDRCLRSLVHAGDYLIVEDTNVNEHLAWPEFGPGPLDALDRFLAENDKFAIDERCERFLMTLNARGYLRRK